MSKLSEHFEIAFTRIEELEKENQSLKKQLIALNKPEELPKANKPVGFNYAQRIREMTTKADAAMDKYTSKLKRDLKKHMRDNDGQT
jgi:hypothetical protein